MLSDDYEPFHLRLDRGGDLDDFPCGHPRRDDNLIRRAGVLQMDCRTCAIDPSRAYRSRSKGAAA